MKRKKKDKNYNTFTYSHIVTNNSYKQHSVQYSTMKTSTTDNEVRQEYYSTKKLDTVTLRMWCIGNMQKYLRNIGYRLNLMYLLESETKKFFSNNNNF